MIINADAKALEWVAGTFLSQDKTAIKEIWDRVDQHSLNQEAFKLPSRLIAKKFVFRLIYGGTAFSYASDVDFEDVSTSQKFWQKVIDRFYDKYQGWAAWHTRLMQEATTTGKVVMPTGREYSYSINQRGDWPRTTILNYPVQGLGADVMAIIRVAFYKRLKKRGINGLIISSVHDSIVVDAPKESMDEIVALFHEVFNDGPKLFEQWFGVKFNLPLQCEVSVGPNMCDLEEVNYAN